MNSKSLASLTIVSLWTGFALSAAEEIWPTHSAGEFAVVYVSQVIRVQAEQCTSFIPHGDREERFEAMMGRVDKRLRVIAADLLLSDDLKSLRQLAVPDHIVATVRDNLDRGRRMIQSDTKTFCPQGLFGLNSATSDEDTTLKVQLRKTMADLKALIQPSEK
jgi:hypothetical protein